MSEKITPPIAYTVGEPAGIGADIILQLAVAKSLNDIVCIGDRQMLEKRAAKLGASIEFLEYPHSTTGPGQLTVLDSPVEQPDVLGTLCTANVDGVLAMLNRAIDGCMDGEFSAMVTGPLHKGVINDAGVDFSGHTEYLAERTGAPLPVMLLASSHMRVALVTTHLPLKAVSAAITRERIIEVCQVIDRDLRSKYGIPTPRLLVCGLNPHAGEGGHLGTEEIDTIIPALEELRTQSIDVTGPLPADTAFANRYLENADVVVAMYHDQGLPVLKSHGFGDAANITLGLPIIRTSVDHGTAFDLAGSGTADIGGLRTAIAVAREMVLAST